VGKQLECQRTQDVGLRVAGFNDVDLDAEVGDLCRERI
jgi:hypothetical protein